MRYEIGLFEKAECLVKTVKKCFFEKDEYLASTYKSGSLSSKLPKKDNVYINEFISYLNQLLYNTYSKKKKFIK